MLPNKIAMFKEFDYIKEIINSYFLLSLWAWVHHSQRPLKISILVPRQ